MAQGRRVRRIVRRVDPWTVLRFSVPFYLCMLVVSLVAGVLLWVAASATGVIDNFERIIKELGGFQTFSFNGPLIFRSTLIGGLVLVLLGSGFNVLMAVVYNLTSDMVGGIEVAVLEEEPPRRTVV